ncbi:PHB depolymerase family esterase [Thalassobaculum sp.]|uniref:alpha/beta hydrolase family esterase n=1 Tax=Thalassobaculum sp. TaxID=2022740 RepID=UPI0032EB1134
MPRPTVSALLLTLAVAGPTAVAPASARAVEPASYTLDDGSYMARPPAGWDGRRPLPLLVFFHGYRQQGSAVMTIAQLTAAADRHGVLLVAPDGLGGSWAHQGSPSSRRDESAFIDALLADIERRWPVDRSRRWAAGFSQGGSMAWHAACFRGRSFTAFMPVAGAFWRPHPDQCPGGPVNLLHTHGTADTVVPMAGRPIGATFHQGDVREGMALWRDQDACGGKPVRATSASDVDCEAWTGCGSGRELGLCLHPGGHQIPQGWAAMAFAWAEAVSSRLAADDPR